MATRRYRVVILGAGFSAPAGVPLAEELWAEVLQRIRDAGLGAKLQEDLHRPLPRLAA